MLAFFVSFLLFIIAHTCCSIMRKKAEMKSLSRGECKMFSSFCKIYKWKTDSMMIYSEYKETILSVLFISFPLISHAMNHSKRVKLFMCVNYIRQFLFFFFTQFRSRTMEGKKEIVRLCVLLVGIRLRNMECLFHGWKRFYD